MDTPELGNRFLEAGHEFSAALDKLGLDCDGIFWAFDQEIGKHVLVLVTDFFDFKGPLEISEHLFRAYNASATPREIDPFVIRLYSVNQPVGADLLRFAAGEWEVQKVDEKTGRFAGPAMGIVQVNLHGLDVKKEWVIKGLKARHRKSTELSRRWERFSRNVDKLAA